MTLSDNMRGALLMVGAMTAYTLGDACMKAIGTNLPLSQSLTLRGIIAAALLGILAWRDGALHVRLSSRDRALIALRSLTEAAAAMFFFVALFNMPFANVLALLQMLPLTITLASAVVFNEPVGWRRWSAIGVGFAGMLLIVRPGTEGFNLYALYALGTVTCITSRDLITRKLSRDIPSLRISFSAAAFALVLALLWSLLQDWQPVSPRNGLLLGATGLLLVGAYALSVAVMRVGDVGFIAPFRYTSLVIALVMGLLVFDEWPSLLSLIGAAMITGTGLFTLWREMRLRRHPSK